MPLEVIAVGAAFLVSSVFVVLMFPLLRRLLEKLRYHEFRAEPVGAAELTARAAEHLDRVTPDMLRLGMRPVGDFRMGHTQRPSFVRIFLSPDRKSFGAIEDYERRKTYAFLTVFEEGTYLESCAVKCRQLYSEPGDPLQFNHLPGVSVDRLWSAHLEAVADCGRTVGSEPIELVPEQYAEVAGYAHRLVWWRLHKEGFAERPPVPMEREPVEIG